MGNWFGRKEQSRIIIQGLDAAGKTSLLYRMKLGEVVTTIPTIGFNVETVDVKGIQITCWDVGGRDKIRPLYRHYYQNTNGFVFVVDSNDRERLDQALDELIKFIFLEDETKETVVMVMANKQDLPGAMSAIDIENELRKKYTFNRNSSHTVFVMPCSVVNGEGIFEAFNCFVDQLRLKKGGKAEPGLLNLSKHAAQIEVERENQSEATKFTLKHLIKNPIGYFKSLFY